MSTREIKDTFDTERGARIVHFSILARDTLSPDSKWLAYVSAESGSQQDIYVVPFRSSSDSVSLGQGKWQITSAGAPHQCGVATAKNCTFRPVPISVSRQCRCSPVVTTWK